MTGSTDSEVILCYQLQKAWRTVGPCWQELQTLLTDTSTLGTVMNLCEQLQCVADVDLKQTPLAAFPDVQDRLIHKLSTSLEETVCKLNITLKSIQSCSQKISRQYEAVMDLYKKYGDKLSLDTMTNAHAKRPSVATQLTMLENVERQFHIIFIQRRHYLEMLNYTEEESAKALHKNWKLDVRLVENINYTLAHVQYFINETL